MFTFLQSFFDLGLLEKFLLISVVFFWLIPVIFFFRSKVKMNRNNQEIDNKISVLEDICDRADIRISKLKYELNKLGERNQRSSQEAEIRKEELSRPTYQEIVVKILSGKSLDEISATTDVSIEELKVIDRLIKASSASQK